MKLFKKSEENDAHEFQPMLVEIEDRPVNPLGRTIFWIIVCTILFFSIWLYVGKVDIVVSARGQFIPLGEVKKVQPLDTGVVRKILCKPGDYVQKGQVLIEIDPSTTEPELESNKEKLINTRIIIKRLQAIIYDKLFEPNSNIYGVELTDTHMAIYTATVRTHLTMIKSKQEELFKIDEQLRSNQLEKERNISLLQVAKNKLARLEKVKDIIAVTEYETTKSEVYSYSKTVETLESKDTELKHHHIQLGEELYYIKENFKNEKLLELSEMQQQAMALEAQIEKIDFVNRKQKILSPVDGFVSDMKIHTVGGVVTPAQEIMTIVPKNIPLVIIAQVLNQDIGFVKEGMHVSIKVDAFNFQKNGMIDGRVKSISKNSILDEQLGPIFKVLVYPDFTELKVEGDKVQMSAGMTVTAEVNVGKRRIIQFFIYPLIKYLDEGLSVR